MSKKIKNIIICISICLILSLGVFCVFAIKNFSLPMGGSIKFIAPGIDATISSATLTGMSKEDGSGQMNSFTVVPTMTESEITALDGYKSWSGLKLLFTDDSEGVATISFNVTNNSSKNTENIMVEISTNTTSSSAIVATPSADFCVTPGLSHTFSIDLKVANADESATLDNFELVVDMRVVKSSEVPSVAQQTQQSNQDFVLSSGSRTATIKKSSTTPTGQINIPKLVKDENDKVYTITKIESDAFYNCRDLTGNLEIPSTVTEIGDYAFMNCTGLSGELILPKGLKKIGQRAFLSCPFVARLVIPEGVEEIPYAAFSGGKYTGLTLPSTLRTIGSSAFSNITSFTEGLVIPEGVTIIKNDAFSSCKFAGELILPSTLKTIEMNAFRIAKGFKNGLTLPEGLETIGLQAFYSCEIAGKLTLPSTLKQVGDNSLDTNKFTGTLELPRSLVDVGEDAFYRNDFSGQLFIPKEMIKIGANAFEGSKYTTIVVEEGNPAYDSRNNCNAIIDSITDELKIGCNYTTIPNDIKAIGPYAFSHCQKMTGNLVIPEGVTKIDTCAFWNCSKLTGTLTLPSTLEYIGYRAFEYCELTGDLFIPKNVTSIYSEAFTKGQYDTITVDPENTVYDSRNNCNAIVNSTTHSLVFGCKNTVIPNNIVSIASYAFYFVRLAGEVVLPEGFTTLNSYALCGTDITSITLPSTIKTIGSTSLSYCSSLKTINILATTPPTLNSNSFYTGLTINIPVGTYSVYSTTSGWSNHASKMVEKG